MLIPLSEAAAILGYSTSGLRKLVARGDVRFFQARPHAPLKFKPEWLEEFIDRGSQPSEPAVRPRKAKRGPIELRHGFDPRLYD
jgi:hypothetical protein